MLLVYPDMSFEVRVTGNSEVAIDLLETKPPFYHASFDMVNTPLGVNLTEVNGDFVVNLGPDFAEYLTELNFDLSIHVEERNTEATVLLDLPGYVGVEGDVELFLDEETSKGTLDVEMAVKIWYTLYPKEYIELFVDTFHLLKAQLTSQVSELTEGRLAIEELTLTDSEIGPLYATVTLTARMIGDFEGIWGLLNEVPLPYNDMPDIEPRFDLGEAIVTKLRTADFHVTFDKEEQALTCIFEGIVDGDIDKQVNVIKGLILEESLRESSLDPEKSEVIYEFLLPTELGVTELNTTVEYSLVDEEHAIEFAVYGLILKPPTPEALLMALQDASKEVSQSSLTLTLNGASDGKKYVEIVVPSTTTEPLVEEPRRVVWVFDDIENLDQVTFDVKEVKAPLILTPQVAILATGAAVAVAVAALMLARRASGVP